MDKEDYQKRLDDQFKDKTKFQKTDQRPHKTDQRLFNNTIKN